MDSEVDYKHYDDRSTARPFSVSEVPSGATSGDDALEWLENKRQSSKRRKKITKILIHFLPLLTIWFSAPVFLFPYYSIDGTRHPYYYNDSISDATTAIHSNLTFDLQHETYTSALAVISKSATSNEYVSIAGWNFNTSGSCPERFTRTDILGYDGCSFLQSQHITLQNTNINASNSIGEVDFLENRPVQYDLESFPITPFRGQDRLRAQFVIQLWQFGPPFRPCEKQQDCLGYEIEDESDVVYYLPGAYCFTNSTADQLRNKEVYHPNQCARQVAFYAFDSNVKTRSQFLEIIVGLLVRPNDFFYSTWSVGLVFMFLSMSTWAFAALLQGRRLHRHYLLSYTKGDVFELSVGKSYEFILYIWGVQYTEETGVFRLYTENGGTVQSWPLECSFGEESIDGLKLHRYTVRKKFVYHSMNKDAILHRVKYTISWDEQRAPHSQQPCAQVVMREQFPSSIKSPMAIVALPWITLFNLLTCNRWILGGVDSQELKHRRHFFTLIGYLWMIQGSMYLFAVIVILEYTVPQSNTSVWGSVDHRPWAPMFLYIFFNVQTMLTNVFTFFDICNFEDPARRADNVRKHLRLGIEPRKGAFMIVPGHRRLPDETVHDYDQDYDIRPLDVVSKPEASLLSGSIPSSTVHVNNPLASFQDSHATGNTVSGDTSRFSRRPNNFPRNSIRVGRRVTLVSPSDETPLLKAKKPRSEEEKGSTHPKESAGEGSSNSGGEGSDSTSKEGSESAIGDVAIPMPGTLGHIN